MSHISRFQEYLQRNHRPLPNYVTKGSGTSFTCSITYEDVYVEGRATNKKHAKEECAKKAFEVFAGKNGSTIPTIALVSPRTSPCEEFVSYVGPLNEFAAKHRVDYPTHPTSLESMSHISRFQEYLQKNRRPLPDYVTKGSGTSFTCSLTYGDVHLEGWATNKKEAKEQCAKKAFEHFAGKNDSTAPTIPLVSPRNSPCERFVNYVGLLNEFAARHRVDYPTYLDPTFLVHGVFNTPIEFMGMTFTGVGKDKKMSKQNAAQLMLAAAEGKDTSSFITSFPQKKFQLIEEDLKDVVDRYDMLSVSPEKRVERNNNILEPSPLSVLPRCESISQMELELKRSGIHYSIKPFQEKKDIYSIAIVVLRIDGTDLTLLGSGESSHEARKDALQTLILMRKDGCSMGVQGNNVLPRC